MKELLSAAFFAGCFALLGHVGVSGEIPPFHLLGKTAGPIACGVIGAVTGFWLSNR
jgi:hypothetical protein